MRSPSAGLVSRPGPTPTERRMRSRLTAAERPCTKPKLICNRPTGISRSGMPHYPSRDADRQAGARRPNGGNLACARSPDGDCCELTMARRTLSAYRSSAGATKLRASLRPLRPDLDKFLFAEVGDETDGNPLSVISALTRLGLDPWEEAGRLSSLATARLLSNWHGLSLNCQGIPAP